MPMFTVIDAESLEVLRWGYVEELDVANQSMAPNEVVIEGQYDDLEYRFEAGPTGLEPIRRLVPPEVK